MFNRSFRFALLTGAAMLVPVVAATAASAAGVTGTAGSAR